MRRSCRLAACLGLGRAASPLGLLCDPESGRYALAEAVNVDVAGGRLHRRPGYTRLAETGFTGLFSDGPNLYGVCDDSLYQIPDQGEPQRLRGGLTVGAPMAFVAVGGTVYFANGYETGRIRDGLAGPWGGGTFPAPDRSGRYGPPPAGHQLAFFAGRIWLARDNLVWFTEGAGLFDWVDAVAGFLPPATGRVRLLRPVVDGLFIGDDAGVVFAAGTDPKTMRFCRVSPRAPLPGSDVTLAAGCHKTMAGQEINGAAALWAAADGIWLGLPDGRATRLAAAAISGARAVAVAGTDRYLLFVNK